MSTNNNQQNSTNSEKNQNKKSSNEELDPEIIMYEKLSSVYEFIETIGLKTKDANFLGSARINYFRGNILNFK
jgi:hypothetical protein